MSHVIETARLILRTWEPSDIELFFKISQDPKVMEFFLRPMTLAEVKAFIEAKNQQFIDKGYTLFATQEKATSQFIGFIGLNDTDWPAHFTPAVEVGWRLGVEYWGKGFATEGAKAVIDYGFKHCALKEIVSFTVPANTRSIHVMEKIGMKHNSQDDFINPNIPSNHPLAHHVLYRITRH